MQTVVDLSRVQVQVVEGLPEACGGGVVSVDEDGIVWVLVEPPVVVGLEREVEYDLDAMIDVGVQAMCAGEPVTVDDQARRFGLDRSVVQCAFWSFAWEWWQHKLCCS